MSWEDDSPRGWKTFCWHTSSDRQHIIPGEAKSSPRIVSVTLKANVALFCWVCLTQTACRWRGVLSGQADNRVALARVNQAVREAINRQSSNELKQTTNNAPSTVRHRSTLVIMWWIEVARCGSRRSALLYLCANTDDIFHKSCHFLLSGEREREREREREPSHRGSTGCWEKAIFSDIEDEMHFTSHCPKYETAAEAYSKTSQ